MAFKVGDTGLTRDGRKYCVTRIKDGTKVRYVEACIEGGEHRYFNMMGTYYLGRQSQIDLMPPDGAQLIFACEAYAAACAHFESAQETLERAKAAVADARIMVERALEQEPSP